MADPAFQAKVRETEKVPGARELTDEAEKVFQGIVMVESGDKEIGVHPDGVSHGPAGLTLPALKDVHRLVCNSSEKLDYQAILKNPVESRKFAKLYYLEMVHRFGDVKTAAIAYHHGPTRVSRWIRQHKSLPDSYWNKVQEAMGD
ncbi:MAG: transglycosylase SLT domain-containing protein [Parcubacteria group bacterium]